MATVRTPASHFGGPVITLSAPKLVQLLDHADLGVQQVDALSRQRLQLAKAQSGEGGHQHHGPEPGLDGIGQLVDLGDGHHRSLGRPLHPAPLMTHGLRAISSSSTAVFRMARSSR